MGILLSALFIFQMEFQRCHVGKSCRILIFGMIRILSYYARPESSTRAQFEISHPNRSDRSAMLRAGRSEASFRWENVVIKVMMLYFRAYKAMSTLVKFGLMPRQWMTTWEHQQELERQKKELAPKMKVVNPATCLHPAFHRYGNVHGSFSKCKRCHQRYKWDLEREGWVVHGSPQLQPSSHLPPPSSSTILPITDMPNKGKGRSGKKGTSSKAKAKPRARATDHQPVEALQVYLPEMESEIPYDSDAYPPSSDGGLDGFHGWDVNMTPEDFA
jgi:hypothetical protein